MNINERAIHNNLDYEKPALVSVISLTHNRRELIDQLLRSLIEQDYSNFEVIVVDNASTDGTVELIETEYPKVRLVRSSENLGNYSYNLGIKVAKGRYLLMIDDDGLPAKANWITQVVARFEADQRLGAVACTIRMQDSGRIAIDSPQFIPRGNPMSGYPCVAYNGTGVGLRAEAIRNIMPLYPKYYFRSWIELYACTGLLSAGWEVRCFPDIEVWHRRCSGFPDPPFAYYGLRNYPWYVLAFYPWPHWLIEIFHYLGSRTKAMFQGRVSISLFSRALRDCVMDMDDAVKFRKPISTSLLTYIREIRRHGNWYGNIPYERPYPGKMDNGKTEILAQN